VRRGMVFPTAYRIWNSAARPARSPVKRTTPPLRGSSNSERMVLDQGEARRGCPLYEAGVQVLATDSLPGLSESRLQQTKITQSIRPARFGEHATVKSEDLSQAEVPRQRSRS